VERIVSRILRFFKNEDGMALATVVAMIAILTILGVALIDQVTNESTRAAEAVKSDAVYQAAESGINDYIAKLTEDSQYYDHCVAKGESTRRSSVGVDVPASTNTASCLPGGESFWTAGRSWTYPYATNRWFGGTGNTSGNSTALRGYAYNLMVTPPSKTAGTNYLTIVSTGCKVVDMNATPLQCDTGRTGAPKQALEVRIRPMTPADFQYIVPPMDSNDPCYASNIYGTMYSSGSIYTCGAHVYGMLEAENYVSGSYTLVGSTSRIYDKNHPDIRSVVKNPFAITDFGASPSSIKRLAGTNVPTTDFEDADAAAWRINFASTGNVQAWKCVYQSGAPDPASSQPFCGGDLTLSTAITANANINTVNVSTSNDEFPSSGKIYIGTGSNQDSFSYATLPTTTSFRTLNGNNVRLSHSHTIGDKVSFVSSGVTWAVPYYNNVPSVGAIYTGKDAIISWPETIAGYTGTDDNGDPTSQVNGRYTLASGQDIIIAGNIHYASEPSPDGISGPDDDVLGLISSSNIWLGKYAPNQLWWRAATMALNGEWSDYCARHSCSRGSDSHMTFVGTMAYSSTDSIMQSGNYGFDTDRVYRLADNGTMTTCPSTATGCTAFDALQFLVPPNYPVINGLQTTVLFHEVPPG
jgi:Tfp pilus assembly protein PilX